MLLEAYGEHNSLQASLLASSTALVHKAADKRLQRKRPLYLSAWFLIARPKMYPTLTCGIHDRLTAITQLVHHGMIFIPIGYTFGAGMFEMEKVKGGSPYGAGTYAGDGSRQPSELELQQVSTKGSTLPATQRSSSKLHNVALPSY